MLLSFLLPVVHRHLRISDRNRKRHAWHQLLVPAMLLIPLLLSVRPKHPVHQLPAIIVLSILCVLLLEVPAWMVLRHPIDPQGVGITSHQRRRHLGDGLRFQVTVYSDRKVRLTVNLHSLLCPFFRELRRMSQHGSWHVMLLSLLCPFFLLVH
jgi:hypothetical protein